MKIKITLIMLIIISEIIVIIITEIIVIMIIINASSCFYFTIHKTCERRLVIVCKRIGK